ncbi:MAG TPA: zf-HC2 domain-containing protein [Thermoanaerobaculia bacterium]|nr:zf-HC2 domain-containing protein [Thermoanaerobaculia bacterium]
MRDQAQLTHHQAWELLPWLVNETLEPGEREGVESHLAACGECRGEAERCRALEALVRSAEVAPSPHPAQLQQLMRRVDEAERTRKRPRLVRLLGARRVNVWWALAAQAAVLVVLLGVVFWPPPPSRFRTLSDARPAAATSAAQRQVRVVFAPTATEAELRRVLLEVRGEVVGGPSPLGAYTIAVPAGAEPLQLVLEHLRADPHVRFAEPVAGAGG